MREPGKKTRQVWMRIDDLKDDIEEAAREDFRTINDEIRWLLTISLELRALAKASSEMKRNVKEVA